MNRVLDHLDLRVGNLEAAKSFYDALLTEFGFRRIERSVPEGEAPYVVYLRIADRRAHEAISVHEEVDHVANGCAFAFRAESAQEVDRIGALLAAMGAREIEGPMACPEYTESYYAVFFRDPGGNRLEVCYR
jgi:catechol 2,3-dioxygenase-like lactoylglutathione lyase family enzyme